MKILQRLKAPTPRVWRQLGNALLGISTLVSGYSMYSDHPTVALISVICGVIGKFLSEFFVENNTQD